MRDLFPFNHLSHFYPKSLPGEFENNNTLQSKLECVFQPKSGVSWIWPTDGSADELFQEATGVQETGREGFGCRSFGAIVNSIRLLYMWVRERGARMQTSGIGCQRIQHQQNPCYESQIHSKQDQIPIQTTDTLQVYMQMLWLWLPPNRLRVF